MDIKINKTTIQLIIIGILIMMFSACSTTKKIKSVSKKSVDSVSVVKIDSVVSNSIDSVSVKKDNTVTTIEKQDDYKKETVIEYPLMTKEQIDAMIQSGRTRAEDYFPVRVTIKETGVKKEKAVIAANLYDSIKRKEDSNTNLKKEAKTDLVKTEVVKNKDVHRVSYWGWLWLLLLIIPVYLVYRYWPEIKLFLKIV